VHPLALATLRNFHVSTEGLRSKSWDELKYQPFDVVITVCDRAKESCPAFPDRVDLVHWSIQDLAEATGTDEEKMRVFRKVFNELQQRIRLYVTLATKR